PRAVRREPGIGIVSGLGVNVEDGGRGGGMAAGAGSQESDRHDGSRDHSHGGSSQVIVFARSSRARTRYYSKEMAHDVCSALAKPAFNRTVTLRETWAKIVKRA